MAQLLRTSADCHFEICAYCFMPDHLHLVVAGTARDASLTEFVRVFKQRSAYHWRQVSSDRLWQRSYFEHVLRVDADLLRAVRYAFENPVRAGLVTRVEDYPFVGSMTMQVIETSPTGRSTRRPT